MQSDCDEINSMRFLSSPVSFSRSQAADAVANNLARWSAGHGKQFLQYGSRAYRSPMDGVSLLSSRRRISSCSSSSSSSGVDSISVWRPCRIWCSKVFGNSSCVDAALRFDRIARRLFDGEGLPEDRKNLRFTAVRSCIPVIGLRCCAVRQGTMALKKYCLGVEKNLGWHATLNNSNHTMGMLSKAVLRSDKKPLLHLLL